MFGDSPILGNKIVKLCSKGRLWLPKFCNAEKGDQLVVQKFDDYFLLVSLNKIVTEIENNKDKKEAITASIVDLVKVDAQSRINIGSHFSLQTELFLHGNYDSVQIFENEEKFNEYAKGAIK